MAEPATPGDISTPPVEPAALVAPDQPINPTGENPTPTPEEPAMVPSDRLREETERRRQAEEETEALRAQLDAKNTPDPSTVTDEVELDADTEKLLDSYARKRGLVSKDELSAQEQRAQVQQDVRDLEDNPPVAGIPYNHQEVVGYAKTHNLPITSKAALQATYKEMNWNKILEVERLKTIDSYKAAGSGGAEIPGSPGATPPVEPELTGKNPKERTRERIRLARQKLTT